MFPFNIVKVIVHLLSNPLAKQGFQIYKLTFFFLFKSPIKSNSGKWTITKLFKHSGNCLQ